MRTELFTKTASVQPGSCNYTPVRDLVTFISVQIANYLVTFISVQIANYLVIFISVQIANYLEKWNTSAGK